MATPFKHRGLAIFCTFSCYGSSITLSRSRCRRNEKIAACPALQLFNKKIPSSHCPFYGGRSKTAEIVLIPMLSVLI